MMKHFTINFLAGINLRKFLALRPNQLWPPGLTRANGFSRPANLSKLCPAVATFANQRAHNEQWEDEENLRGKTLSYFCFANIKINTPISVIKF